MEFLKRGMIATIGLGAGNNKPLHFLIPISQGQSQLVQLLQSSTILINYWY